MPLLLWLHGLGDTGAGWSSLQYDLSDVKVPDPAAPLRFQFPTAPQNTVTCNGGAKMTSWFDLEAIPITPNVPDFEDDYWATVSMVGASSILLRRLLARWCYPVRVVPASVLFLRRAAAAAAAAVCYVLIIWCVNLTICS